MKTGWLHCEGIAVKSMTTAIVIFPNVSLIYPVRTDKGLCVGGGKDEQCGVK